MMIKWGRGTGAEIKWAGDRKQILESYRGLVINLHLVLNENRSPWNLVPLCLRG